MDCAQVAELHDYIKEGQLCVINRIKGRMRYVLTNMITVNQRQVPSSWVLSVEIRLKGGRRHNNLFSPFLPSEGVRSKAPSEDTLSSFATSTLVPSPLLLNFFHYTTSTPIAIAAKKAKY
jgi:hypothetical protein